MNGYLIPANTKNGNLIFGIFKPFDLILFGSGIFVTIIFLALIPIATTWMTILILMPTLITGFLVIPIPYYHNLMTVIIELFKYITNRQKYYWKGWCINSGDEGKEETNGQ